VAGYFGFYAVNIWLVNNRWVAMQDDMYPEINLKDLENWRGQNFAKPCKSLLEGEAKGL